MGKAKAAAAAKPAKIVAMPKKAPAKKAAKAVVIETSEPEEELDSRGRRIGKRGARAAPQGGLMQISAEERTLLRSLAHRGVAAGDAGPLARAFALEVGEVDVALGDKYQSFVMSLSQAKRAGTLDGREFNYTTGVFSPGAGLKGISVLYIERTA